MLPLPPDGLKEGLQEGIRDDLSGDPHDGLHDDLRGNSRDAGHDGGLRDAFPLIKCYKLFLNENVRFFRMHKLF